MKTGICHYVLPKYSNASYIDIEKNTVFGLTDMVLAILNKVGSNITDSNIIEIIEREHSKGEDVFSSQINLKRGLTVRVDKGDDKAEMLSINK